MIAIPSGRTDRASTLRIDCRSVDASSSADGAIHHLVAATLVETDRAGRTLRERPVYASDADETVD